MSHFKKHALAATFAAGMLAAGAVQAAPAIGFDPTGAGAYGYYADTLTNDTDSALSLGFIPGAIVGVPLPGAIAPYDTTLVAQTNVNALTLNGSQQLAIGPGSGYELTKVTAFSETVTSQFGATVSWTQPGAVQPDIDVTNAGSQQLMIFFDSTPDSDPNDATGYADGTLILSAHIVDVAASFTAFSPTSGVGAFQIYYVIDFVDANYLDVVTGSIFMDIFQGNTNIPSLYNPVAMWDGTPTGNGLLLRMDSSQNFAIPEPATLTLAGLALLAAGALGRRRS